MAFCMPYKRREILVVFGVSFTSRSTKLAHLLCIENLVTLTRLTLR